MSKISDRYSKMQIETIGIDREQRRKQRRKNAYNLSYAHREIGEFERKTDETAPSAHKPNGWLWKRASCQVGRNSLEWAHWEKFLSIWEFSVKKNAGPRDLILTVEEGKLKTVNEFACFPPTRVL